MRATSAPPAEDRAWVREEARELPVLADVDVLVCGGGPAGTAAAIAAARNGSKTLLLERHGFLGGMATAGLVVPHWDSHQNGGVNADLIDRLESREGWGAEGWKISFDPELWKHVSEDLVLDSGSDLLYHTFVVGTLRTGRAVKGVVIETKSGRFAVLARVVVDCTGDGDVAARAGAHFEKGRGDGLMQPMTTMFRLGGVTWVQRRNAGLRDLIEQAIERTGDEYRLPYDYPWAIHLPNPGEVAVMLVHVRDVDGTDVRDLTRAESTDAVRRSPSLTSSAGELRSSPTPISSRLPRSGRPRDAPNHGGVCLDRRGCRKRPIVRGRGRECVLPR
ncbi:FAD-dependent oxidoreductase [Jiangella anatolica]|uniref:FAD-dependent oxidoreductase n=1 Tax=Jiangella anatolica TaxID=2670374 RepID=UPI0013145972|nr:FAD-dependent oxidoreductase [Jiangella anatolica]